MTLEFEELKSELVRVCAFPPAINKRFNFRIVKVIAPGNTYFSDSYRCEIYYYGHQVSENQFIKLKMVFPIDENINTIAMRNAPKLKHSMKYCMQQDSFIKHQFPELVI